MQTPGTHGCAVRGCPAVLVDARDGPHCVLCDYHFHKLDILPQYRANWWTARDAGFGGALHRQYTIAAVRAIEALEAGHWVDDAAPLPTTRPGAKSDSDGREALEEERGET